MPWGENAHEEDLREERRKFKSPIRHLPKDQEYRMLARVLGLSNKTGTIKGKDHHGESVLKRLLDALLRLKCAAAPRPSACPGGSPRCCCPAAAALPALWQLARLGGAALALARPPDDAAPAVCAAVPVLLRVQAARGPHARARVRLLAGHR